jgi:hypothetical protein
MRQISLFLGSELMVKDHVLVISRVHDLRLK